MPVIPTDFELPALVNSAGVSLELDFELSLPTERQADRTYIAMLIEGVVARIEAGEHMGTIFGPNGSNIGWYKARPASDI